MKTNRKNFYPVVEEILGRKLTITEHETIKTALLSFEEAEQAENLRLNNMLQRQGKKLTQAARVAYGRGKNAEILEKDMVFLKEVFENQNE